MSAENHSALFHLGVLAGAASVSGHSAAMVREAVDALMAALHCGDAAQVNAPGVRVSADEVACLLRPDDAAVEPVGAGEKPARTRRASNAWSDADMSVLRELYCAGHSDAEIAQAVSRKAPAVSAKIKYEIDAGRLERVKRSRGVGTKRHHYAPWSDEEKAALKALLADDSVSWQQIVKRMGRSVADVARMKITLLNSEGFEGFEETGEHVSGVAVKRYPPGYAWGVVPQHSAGVRGA